MSTHPLKGGVWSATPTPFADDWSLDVPSVRRLVEHHIAMGVTGVMLAGTCGEGPWMRLGDRETLTRTAVEAARGRLRIALQVTDNSAARVLDNIGKAAAWGAEVAVVEAPYFFLNATPERLLGHYREIARGSPLPMGLYDRGKASAFAMPESQLPALLAEPNIAMVKDSSMTESRRDLYLAARRARPGLVVLTGGEFDTVAYLKAGYDGALLGGGIFNARLALRILEAVRAGNLDGAGKVQARMNDLMYRVYGGPKIECWLSGLKELLVRMGIFTTRRNLLEYPLTAECLAQIRAALDGSDGLGYRKDLLGS
jgi:4-hydroxy-tetrahydrodipicolinate synthase